MSIAKDLLYQLAVENGLDALELVKYVDEDNLGGYHWNSAQSKWNVGSVFESEGQMLYSLVRYLKPETIVEIGSFHGCSTAHMALALKANGSGKIIAVDDVRNGAFHDQYPTDLKGYVEQVVSEGSAYLASLPPNSIDFVFEDAGHGEEDTYSISKAALVALKGGGWLINHDAMHDWAVDGNGNRSPADDGAKIRAGLTRAGADFKTYIAPAIARDSDCGIAVTHKLSGSLVDIHSTSIAPIESEDLLKPSENYVALIDYAVDHEPLASEEDNLLGGVGLYPLEIGGDDEPLAKEEIELSADDTVILPAEELPKPKKKPGRKPKTK